MIAELKAAESTMAQGISEKVKEAAQRIGTHAIDLIHTCMDGQIAITAKRAPAPGLNCRKRPVDTQGVSALPATECGSGEEPEEQMSRLAREH